MPKTGKQKYNSGIITELEQPFITLLCIVQNYLKGSLYGDWKKSEKEVI
jgi:hypothetical protein